MFNGARVEARLTLRPDQVLQYAFRSHALTSVLTWRVILEEYGLAMLNRDIKLIFWIVPVICVIFSPTKGKFIRLSLTKVYNYIHLLQLFFHIESILYKVPFLKVVKLALYYGRGPNRLK